MEKEKLLKAGKIASKAKQYARSIIKKDMLLLEIAEKIEDKIIELGGKPAFPASLSIDSVAAHTTPSPDDKSLAHGLLKVDIGVHVDGWIVDTAFSLDLENNEENKKIISASEKALENALKIINQGVFSTNEIGEAIQNTIESYELSPIMNLSGHEINLYNVHAGITIPNIQTKNNVRLKEGIYAIEPFASSGSGKVHNGKPSNVYIFANEKSVRSQIAREILNFVKEEYNGLPFCSRWIVRKFGHKAIFGLKQLEDNGNIHHFPELVESEGKVSQAENTILIEKDKVTILTE